MKEIFEMRLGDYKCNYCLMRYETTVKLKEHIVEHFTEVYYCKDCVKVVTVLNQCQVKLHVCAHSKQMHCCVFCSRLFTELFHLYIHVHHDHRDNNKTQCKICGSSYVSKQSFTRHVRRKHGDLIALVDNVEIFCNVHSSERTVSNCLSNDAVLPTNFSQQHGGEAKAEVPCSEPDMNVLREESPKEQNSSDSKFNISKLNSAEKIEVAASPISKHETNDDISFNPLIRDTSSKYNTDFDNLLAFAASEFKGNASPTDSMGSTFPHLPTYHDTVGLDEKKEHSKTEVTPDIPHTYFELSYQSEKIYTCNVCHMQCNNETDFLVGHFSLYGCIAVKKSEEKF